MKPVFDFIVEPVGERYNNEVEVGNKKLVLNSEIFNHEFINRIGKVKLIMYPECLNLSIPGK